MDEKIVITESPNLKSLNNEQPKTGFLESIKSTFKISDSSSPENTSLGSSQEYNKNESGVNTVNSTASKSANFLSNLGWSRIVLIIVLLLFLGINIFRGMANVGDWFVDKVAPFFKKIFGILGITTVKVTEKAVDVTATGAKTGIDIAAGTIESGLGVIEGQLQNAQQSNAQQPNAQQPNAQQPNAQQPNAQQQSNTSKDTLSTALASTLPQIPEPDDATSSTQKNTSGKAGYCYIGEDRGFRSCVQVNEDNICMSGQIFPTNAICVNPNLRE